MLSLAFIRASRADIARLITADASAHFLEPPVPFAALDAFDAPNSDDLGMLFFNATRARPVGDSTVGAEMYGLWKEFFERAGGGLVLFEVPQPFVAAIAALEDDEVPWAAVSALLLPVDRPMRNPFTNEPVFAEGGYREHVRRIHAALANEIRAFRDLFRAARNAGEHVWLWAE